MARTKIGTLTQAMGSLNPWWRSPRWASDDPDLREVRGTGLGYEADCLADLRPGGLYVLRGPRRVGKTVATKQAISRLIDGGLTGASIVRIAVDDWSAKDLVNAVQTTPLPLVPSDSRRWWFIDEITGATGDWASAIKWLRDNHAPFRDATVVITGSNASALTEAIGLWAGRRGQVPDADRTLLPIGFRSFVDLLSRGANPLVGRLDLADLRSSVGRDAYQSLVPWLGDLSVMWERYLLGGGFPVAVAAARQAAPVPMSFLDDIFSVIFRFVLRDSQANEMVASSLVARILDGMGSPSNLRSIAADVGMDHKTVARHVAYLENGYLLWGCPQKDDDRWLPQPRSQAKLYAIDPVVARLAHLRNAARPDLDITVLNEMVLGATIRRAVAATGRSWSGDESLFHVRTPSRKEIDFVSESLGVAAIEGKYTESGAWRSEAATVNASAWKGILGTRAVLDTSDADRAWAVPSGILAYLIDA